MSDVELQFGEYAAGHRGAVDVARVTLITLVEIALVAVEYVLHAGIDLNRRVVEQLEIVVYLDVGVEETRGVDSHVDRCA